MVNEAEGERNRQIPAARGKKEQAILEAQGYRERLVLETTGRIQAFEAQLTRMSGLEDGIVDALFSFSRPVTGGYFWCPPVRDGKLNLEAVGL